MTTSREKLHAELEEESRPIEVKDSDRLIGELRRQIELLEKISNDLHLVYLVVLWGIIIAVVTTVLSILHNLFS